MMAKRLHKQPTEGHTVKGLVLPTGLLAGNSGRLSVAAIMLAASVLGVATTLAQEVPGSDTPPPGHMKARYLAYVRESLDTLMAAWESGWNLGAAGALADSYAEDALLVAGGGAPIVGREKIVEHLRSARSTAGRITVGLSDFAASDNIAFEFGSFRFIPPEGDARATSGFGHYLAVIRRYGRHWRIRAQLLLPAGRQEKANWFRIQASAPSGDCSRAPGSQGVNAAHAAWREAWRRDDVEAVAELFMEGGLLMLPGEQPLKGREAIKSRLDTLLPNARTLHSCVIDLAESGRLAYAYGRYYSERGLGNNVLGHFVSVHNNEGGDWLFRTLILWPDSEP